MRALYWNVCSEAPKDKTIADVTDLIESEQIDVACLSEVPYSIQPKNKGVHVPLSEVLAAELGMDSVFEHTRTIGRRSDTRLRGYGTAIISRSGILSAKKDTLRDDIFTYMTPGEGNKRTLLSVRTEQSPDIEVAVAHLSYPMPIPGSLKGLRAERLRLIELLEEKAAKGSLLFGGDMNVRPNGNLDHQIESTGLKVVSDTSEPTFRSRHWYAGHTVRNLDRIYATPDLGLEVTVHERQQSDHHPLIVEVY